MRFPPRDELAAALSASPAITSSCSLSPARTESSRAGARDHRSTSSQPKPFPTRTICEPVCEPRACTRRDRPRRIRRLDVEIGIAFADAANTLLKNADVDRSEVAAIGSHGQTVGTGPPASSVHAADRRCVRHRRAHAHHDGRRFPSRRCCRRRSRRAAVAGAACGVVRDRPRDARHRQPRRHRQRHRACTRPRRARLRHRPGELPARCVGPAPSRHGARRRRRVGAERSRRSALARCIARAIRTSAARAPKSTGREYFNLDWLDARLRHVASRRTTCRRRCSRSARAALPMPSA